MPQAAAFIIGETSASSIHLKNKHNSLDASAPRLIYFGEEAESGAAAGVVEATLSAPVEVRVR